MLPAKAKRRRLKRSDHRLPNKSLEMTARSDVLKVVCETQVVCCSLAASQLRRYAASSLVYTFKDGETNES